MDPELADAALARKIGVTGVASPHISGRFDRLSGHCLAPTSGMAYKMFISFREKT